MCIGICRRAPTWGLSKYTKTKFMCWALTESLFSAAQSQQPQKKLEKREKSGNKIASLTFLGTVIKFMSSRCFWEGGCRIKGGKWVHEERGGGVEIRKNVCMKRVKTTGKWEGDSGQNQQAFRETSFSCWSQGQSSFQHSLVVIALFCFYSSLGGGQIRVIKHSDSEPWQPKQPKLDKTLSTCTNLIHPIHQLKSLKHW